MWWLMLSPVASHRGDIGTEASNGDLFLETAGTLLAIMCLRQNGRSVLFLSSLFVGRWWFLLLVLVNCCCVSSFHVISWLLKEWVTELSILVLVVSELVVGLVIGGSCLELVIVNKPRNHVVVANQIPLFQVWREDPERIENIPQPVVACAWLLQRSRAVGVVMPHPDLTNGAVKL